MSKMFPYAIHWWEPLWDYKLTGLSLAATAAVALRYLYHRRRRPSLLPFGSFSRSLVFYWPVYIWGFDSLGSFWEAQFSGCGPGPTTASEYVDWTMRGCATIAGSAVILCAVVLFGAGLQFAFIKLLPAARGGTVGVPLSACAVALGIMGLELSLVVLLLSLWGNVPK